MKDNEFFTIEAKCGHTKLTNNSDYDIELVKMTKPLKRKINLLAILKPNEFKIFYSNLRLHELAITFREC